MKAFKGERGILRLAIVLAAGLGLITAGAGLAGSEPAKVVIAGVAVPASVPHALENGGVKDLQIPLELAKSSYKRIEAVKDYQCWFLRVERLGGKLEPVNVIRMKVRHKPFSVYMKWLKGGHGAGREVLYVDGKYNGKMIVHDEGIAGQFVKKLHMAPDDPLVKNKSRHPITHAGILNLTRRLRDRWAFELKRGETQVWTDPRYKVDKRPCWYIKTRHPNDPKLAKARGGVYMFYRMNVYFDKQHLLPVRLEGYDWPTPARGPNPFDAINVLGKKEPEAKDGPVVCVYTYARIQFDIGLSDRDFDWRNPEYAFH